MAETYEDLIELGLGQRLPSAQWEQMRLNQLYFRNKNRYFYSRGVTDGNYQTASSTYSDIDATNMACTLTTTGNPVRVQLYVGTSTISAGVGCIQILYDGVAVLGGNDMFKFPAAATGTYFNFEWIIPALAGSHTFKLQFRNSNNANNFVLVDDNGIWFEVCEI